MTLCSYAIKSTTVEPTTDDGYLVKSLTNVLFPDRSIRQYASCYRLKANSPHDAALASLPLIYDDIAYMLKMINQQLQPFNTCRIEDSPLDYEEE